MIIPERDKPVHTDGNAALTACYARALDKAVHLLENYRAFLAGDAELDPGFLSNYESEEPV